MKKHLSDSIAVSGVRLTRRVMRTGLFPTVLYKLALATRNHLFSEAHEITVLIPLGMNMVLPPGQFHSSYKAGFEPEVTHQFLQLVREGMTIVDVGAFAGYYTLISSRLAGREGKVYSFEPHPLNFSYLCRNVEYNNCTNVVPLDLALSNTVGKAPLVEGDYPTVHRLYADLNMGDTEYRSISVLIPIHLSNAIK